MGGYNFLITGLIEAVAHKLPARLFDRTAAERDAAAAGDHQGGNARGIASTAAQ